MTRSTCLSSHTERDLRRQIDRCVGQALVDDEYARNLLRDPTLVLDNRGCPPQYYMELRSINATDLVDFARQAYALFWAAEPERTAPVLEERPLAAVAL